MDERQIDGWMSEWIERLKDYGQIEGQRNRQIDGQIIDVQIDGFIQTDRHIDRLIDVQADRQTDR